MNPPVRKLMNVSNSAKGQKKLSWIGSSTVVDPVPFTTFVVMFCAKVPVLTVHVPPAVPHAAESSMVQSISPDTVQWLSMNTGGIATLVTVSVAFIGLMSGISNGVPTGVLSTINMPALIQSKNR